VALRRERPAAGAAGDASNSDASVTPSAADSFSRTTAVGLLSPRSISEIIERLTPLLPDSASRDRPRAVRSFLTRAAMRRFRLRAVSAMWTQLSIILKKAG
jgi:hypothetical protein